MELRWRFVGDIRHVDRGRRHAPCVRRCVVRSLCALIDEAEGEVLSKRSQRTEKLRVVSTGSTVEHKQTRSATALLDEESCISNINKSATP